MQNQLSLDKMAESGSQSDDPQQRDEDVDLFTALSRSDQAAVVVVVVVVTLSQPRR